VFTERTSVGLDVHARSVAAAAIDGVTGEFVQSRLTPSHEHIFSWLQDLPEPVAVAYEAGPTGFGLYRSLTEAGIRCEVVAPSKLQRPSGDRVKTDAKDAVHLARLLRLDEVVSVFVHQSLPIGTQDKRPPEPESAVVAQHCGVSAEVYLWFSKPDYH
jgi:transposase